MLNVIDRALADASKAAREQSEQMLNELNSASECMMSAKLVFEREMTEARKLHEMADRKQAEAIRNFDANLIQMNAIIVALKRQIADGEIVSGVVSEGEQADSLPPPEEPTDEPGEPPSTGLKRLQGMTKGIKGGSRAAA